MQQSNRVTLFLLIMFLLGNSSIAQTTVGKVPYVAIDTRNGLFWKGGLRFVTQDQGHFVSFGYNEATIDVGHNFDRSITSVNLGYGASFLFLTAKANTNMNFASSGFDLGLQPQIGFNLVAMSIYFGYNFVLTDKRTVPSTFNLEFTISPSLFFVKK